MTKDSKDPGFDELARQFAESVPENLRTLGDDMQRSAKALLQRGFERMDLVSREEFDVQKAVLQKTREKVEQLEARLAELEQSLSQKTADEP